jgi:hypothetical protein
MTAMLPTENLNALIARFRRSVNPSDAAKVQALEVLQKGTEDMNRIIGLIKAAGVKDDADPETESEEGKPDTTEGEADGESMGKGYGGKPMAKGDGGGGESEDGETSDDEEGEGEAGENMGKGAEGVSIVDATELVKGLDSRLAGLTVLANQILDEHRATAARQDALEARLSNMEAVAKGLQEQTSIMAQATCSLGEHVATGFVALTKASMEAALSARELAPGVSGTPLNAQRAIERHAVPDMRGTGATFDTQALIKGSNQRVITQAQANLYKITGRFDNDDARNTELVTKMTSINTINP